MLQYLEGFHYLSILIHLTMKRLLLATLVLAAPLASAQKLNLIDSLKTALRGQMYAPETRVALLLAMAEAYKNNDLESMYSYADSARAVAEEDDALTSQLPQAFFLMGIARKNQGHHLEALRILEAGLERALALAERPYEPMFYSALADVHDHAGDRVKSLELNQKALSIFTERKDTLNIIKVHNSIGVIYWEQDDPREAMKYYKKAARLNALAGRALSNAQVMNNIGLVHKQLGQYDSALYYFEEGLALLPPDNTFGIAIFNNNLGITFRALGNDEAALTHFQRAKAIQQKIEDRYGLGLVNQNIGEVYLDTKDFRGALPYFKEGLSHAEAIRNNSLLSQINGSLAKAYAGLGNFSDAYRYQLISKTYDDSIRDKSQSEALAKLEVAFQVKQKQAENDLLKAQNDLNAATLRSQSVIIIGGVVVVSLIGGLLLLSYRALRSRQKSNNAIREKNTLLQQLYDDLEKKQQAIENQKREIELQNSVLQTKNQRLEELNHERASIMGIVAHDLKSPFNAIGGIAGILPKLGALSDEQKSFLSMMDKVVDNGYSLIKNLIDFSAIENRDVQPQLAHVNVHALVTKNCAAFRAVANEKNIHLDISLPPANLDVVSDIGHLDRILQNLISNALKFSPEGKRIEVGAIVHEDSVELFVKDEGPGIKDDDRKLLFKKFQRLSARPTKDESSSGLGLYIVKSLADQLQATIHVESMPGHGATFRVAIPLAKIPQQVVPAVLPQT